MNKIFAKENFLFSTFDNTQRKQSLFVAGMLVVFFIASSFTFFNMLYCFSDILGSIVSGSPDVAIKDLLRSLPLFLSFFMSLWTVLLLQATFRNVGERRIKSMKKNAIVIMSMAGFNILYILIMRIAGQYLSLVEGSPSPLYPLDAILHSLVYIAIGVFTFVYVLKLQERLPYEVPTRGTIVTKARGLYCFGITIWMLIALYSFSAFIYGLFIQDFAHGYVFYSIALLLVFFVNFIFLGFWEFYYNELKDEVKPTLLFPLSLAGLICSVITIGLYFVGLGTNLDGPSNAGFGILPVAFAASVNIATLIVVFTPLIVSVIAFIKSILMKKKASSREE